MLLRKEISMFDEKLPPRISPAKSQAEPVKLTATTPLHAALGGFREHMARRNLTENTIKSFQYDLNILGQFVSQSRPVIPSDPAAPLVHKPVSTPLPDILFDAQVEQLLATTNMLRHSDSQGAGERKPDARPHLLVSLLLTTGIKKSECMALVLNHLDLSEPEAPAVWIRYGDARHRHKERRLKLDAAWPRVLEEYKAQYKINDKLFPCTARNLEYVLRDVGQLADLPKPVSFEMLRWTCAVRDARSGMSEEQLRHKLGLSKITWEEAGTKIAKLAAPAL
jgi:site-specific recombinase XerD